MSTRILIVFLSMILFNLAQIAGAVAKNNQLKLIDDSVIEAAALGENQVIAICSDGGADPEMFARFVIYDTEACSCRLFEPQWKATDHGWQESGYPRCYMLTSSPDYTYIAYLMAISLPDEIEIDFPAMSECLGIFLCNTQSAETELVGLSIEVGGGPEFGFSTDSKRLYGQPIMSCDPTPQDYADYLNDTEYTDRRMFNYIDVESRERRYMEGVDISDGFWKCPYTDNYRIENNWYQVHTFSNFMSGQLGTCALPEEGYPSQMSWVLADAMLLNCPQGSRLMYIDGALSEFADSVWLSYCWLSDGNYLFSDDGGKHVKYGKVDWSTFTIDWWVDLELNDNLEMMDVFSDASGNCAYVHNYSTQELYSLNLDKSDRKP